MKVILAQPRGFCAGVERAIEIVEMALDKFGPPIYVRHEIVHNPHVVKRLAEKGVKFVEETDEVPAGAVTIFSAHGVAEEIEKHAKLRGLQVLDATCPLVSKVHTEGQRYAKSGREIILIGHEGHPEIEGTLGRIPGVVHLVSEPKDVARLKVKNPDMLAYITQTTLSVDDTKSVIDALKARFPNIVGPATKDICYATQNRQAAVRELSKHVDVVLVIGAHNSSNSNRLQECAREEGIEAYLIEDASHLNIDWVKGKKTVGITAGASAPEDLVQELIERLKQIEPVEVSFLPGVNENVHFRLPLALTKAEGRRNIYPPLLPPENLAKRFIVSVPLRQQFDIALYMLKQKISGNKHYPLVLMLEPLFRCNLACAGCGKIDYPDEILNQRLSVEECLKAVDECGAPVVSIPGGEPLLHREMPEIVKGIIARKKYVYLCTNALLMEKKMDQYAPSPYFTWSVHLDGGLEDHDRSVCQDGVYVKAEAAIKKAIAKGFRVNINATLFNNAVPERQAEFFDHMMDIGLNAITVSPGYAYERAPDQEHFLTRETTHNLFRDIFRIGKERAAQGKTKWRFSQSSLYMDFLAGNQTYECTPWGNPTRNIFGWQRPCYLLGEGYARTFKELIDTTEWDKYGTGKYEKCANCMVHCGYEPTAAEDAISHPIKSLIVALRGPKTEGAMAKDIDLSQQRPAEYVFSTHVQEALAKIHAGKILDAAHEAEEKESVEAAE